MVENCEQRPHGGAQYLLDNGEAKSAIQAETHGVMVRVGGRFGAARGYSGHMVISNLFAMLAKFHKYRLFRAGRLEQDLQYLKHEFSDQSAELPRCLSQQNAELSVGTAAGLVGSRGVFEGVMKIVGAG